MGTTAGDQRKEIDEILKDLAIAFANLSIPPEDRIVYDNSGYHLECNQIRAKFRNRHWRELSIDDLEGEADSLCFLTSEAFCFFLPAFIRVSLLYPALADLIPDTILGLLARPDLGEREKQLREAFREHSIPERVLLDLSADEAPEIGEDCKARVAALSELQRHSVIRFVRYLRTFRREEFALDHLNRVEEALQSA